MRKNTDFHKKKKQKLFFCTWTKKAKYYNHVHRPKSTNYIICIKFFEKISTEQVRVGVKYNNYNQVY